MADGGGRLYSNALKEGIGIPDSFVFPFLHT